MLPFRKTWVFSCGLTALLLTLLLILLLPTPTRADSSWPEVPGRAQLVMEAASGTVLFGVAEAEPLPPASTTKIATALLVLSVSADLERPVIISPAAAQVGESSIYLKAGETLTLADLLRGALVHSGNDACFALAEAVAGSEPLFVHWLNLQALLLGADTACFRNTNGLPAAGHALSALDLATCTRYALRQPFFAQTVSSLDTELGTDSNYRYFRNTNRLLGQDPHIVGVKTGTTDAAGPCLVAAWQSETALYISVVLNSADRYGASLALLRFASEHCPVLEAAP